MSKQADKGPTPAYGSFKTLTSFLNEVRDVKGHVPMRIDRGEMPKLSGSAANETIATLRFFGLTSGDQSTPTPLFEQYVMAKDEDRPPILARMVRKAYSFVFDAPNFDVERATAQQVHELFRDRGVNGSTLARAVSLFIASTKAAGIKISPSIKPPKLVSAGNRPKREKKVEQPAGQPVIAEPTVPDGVHRFELPIPGKPSVQVLVPESLDGADWDMLSKMFSIYVERWKGYTPPSKTTHPSKEEPSP